MKSEQEQPLIARRNDHPTRPKSLIQFAGSPRLSWSYWLIELFSYPRRLSLFAEGFQAFLGILGHRQQCHLAFGVGDALVERHRGDRAHGVFATPDRGRRLVDDAAEWRS